MTIAAGTMMAAGAVSSIVGANNARQVAKGNEAAQKDAVDNQIIENRRRATTDYLRDVRLEELQSQQENQAVQEKAGDIAQTTLDAKGTAVASSAERGIAGGRSLDTILADFDFQQNQEVGRIRQNQAMQDQQHQENAGAYVNEFDARVAAVQPYVPKTQAPVDYFSPVFGMGAAMLPLTGAGSGGTKGLSAIIGGMGTKVPSPDITTKDYRSLAM